MRVVFVSDCGLYLSALERETTFLESVETHVATSLAEVELLIAKSNIDVIALDDRAAALRDSIFELCRTSPFPPRILVLNADNYLSPEAAGHVLRGARAEDIASALLLVKRGYRVVPPTEVKSHASTRQPHPSLIPEELNILRLLSTGAKQTVIAKRLSQSEASLKRRISVINRKMGVERSTEAIAVAIRERLI